MFEFFFACLFPLIVIFGELPAAIKFMDFCQRFRRKLNNQKLWSIECELSRES